MRAALVVGAFALASGSAASPSKSAACNVREAGLIGNWVGGGPFEEMQFAKEDGINIFNSWLHHRPDFYGARWNYADCRLKIFRDDQPMLTYHFRVKFEGRKLVLVDADDGNVTKYRRITS